VILVQSASLGLPFLISATKRQRIGRCGQEVKEAAASVLRGHHHIVSCLGVILASQMLSFCSNIERIVRGPLLDWSINYSPPRVPQSTLSQVSKRRLVSSKARLTHLAALAGLMCTLCLLPKPHGDRAVCDCGSEENPD